MDSQTATVGCVVAGVVLVAVAGLALDPPGDRQMVVTHVDGMGDPGPADVTYADLPPSAQAAVGDALDDGYAFLSTYDDYAAVTALRGEKVIRRDDQKYVVRTTSADGGHLAGTLVHRALLAVGGVLVGAGAYIRTRRRATAVAVPLCATAAILSVNALAAPVLSLVDWVFLGTFGLATAVPVLGGVAVQRRDRTLGVLTALTLCCAIAPLLLGVSVSGLDLLVPLGFLGLPGLLFGWRLDRAVSPGADEEWDLFGS